MYLTVFYALTSAQGTLLNMLAMISEIYPSLRWLVGILTLKMITHPNPSPIDCLVIKGTSDVIMVNN